MPIPKITSIFPRIKNSSGNSGNSDIENMELDLQEITTNEATPSSSSPSHSDLPSLKSLTDTVASKRLRSDDSEKTDEPKRQNLNSSVFENDNLSFNLESSKSSPENVLKTQTSPNLESSGSLFDQLEVSFEPNTPHWVPLLLKSFDSLTCDLKSNMACLSQEVKSVSAKFDTFSADLTNRMDALELKSLSLSKDQGEISQRVISMETEIKTLKSICNEYEKSLNFLSVMHEDSKKGMAELSEKNQNLNNLVEKLSAQVDNNEQHNRNDCLLLHGIPEKSRELPNESKNLFVKSVNENLGLNISTDAIHRAHRLGKKRQNGKPRPIIARFLNFEARNEIYLNKKKFRGKPISVTENLTAKRMHLKYTAEQNFGPNNVWTKEGRIYSKDPQGNLVTICA